MNDDGRILRRPQKALVIITNLNAIVLLVDGLEHSVPSRNVRRLYSPMCPHGSRATKQR
jgi:hypothetical protein